MATSTFMLTNGIPSYGNKNHYPAFINFDKRRIEKKQNHGKMFSSPLIDVDTNIVDNSSINTVDTTSAKDDDDESLRLLQALDPNYKQKEEDGFNLYTSNDDPLLSVLQLDQNTKQRNRSQSSPHIETTSSFMDHLSSNDNNLLPFECTGCGKCCQTKGEVYLNPKETINAANTLNISVEKFKQKYVEREIKSKSRPDESWTVLKQMRDSNGIEGCIFLDEETKFCSIYEARPLQCSTYPFWPRIMESLDSWNEEVVFKSAADTDHSGHDDRDGSDNKVWTSEYGGCEGMNKIEDISSSGRLRFANTSSSDDASTGHDDFLGDNQRNGVSVEHAKDRLESYTRYKRAFPRQ